MNIDHDKKQIIFDTCHNNLVYKNWLTNLDSLYNKSNLVEILEQITDTFPGYTIHFSNEPWAVNLRELITRGKQSKKAILTEMVAKIYAEESNRRILLEILSEQGKVVWRTLMRNIYLSEELVKQIIGEYPICVVKNSYYSERMQVHPTMIWFGYIAMGGWYKKFHYFFIPTFIRDAFKSLFPLGELNPYRKVETDEPQEYITMQLEHETLALVPVIKNLWLNGNLEMGRFKVGATAINKVAKMTKVAEFTFNPDDRNARNLRASMLFNAFTIYGVDGGLNKSAISEEPQDLVKKMVKRLKANPSALAATLLFFIDKSTARLYEGNTIWAIWNNVSGILCSHPVGEWIDMEAFMDNLYHISDINNTLRVISFRALDESMVCNTRTGHSLNPSNMLQEVSIPAMLSMIALFTSLGLLEISYRPVSDVQPSPLCGLQKARLTSLGAYVFGLTQSYVYTVPTDVKYFELGDDRLLIRALGDTNPYEGMLSQFASSVGARRYAVSPESFLTDCSSRKDIERKIAAFKQVVCASPPVIWEEFFKRLLNNSNCFKSCTSSYKIFDISPEAHELHELLVTNPAIRNCILRAEGYRILVPYEKISQLISLLKCAGYLL
ncbi:MAG: hypothetical protein NC339_05220 [Muribaculaceae bacterium]|nr:hypothetical protein [Muribaculaceae bacterium]